MLLGVVGREDRERCRCLARCLCRGRGRDLVLVRVVGKGSQGCVALVSPWILIDGSLL